MTSTRMATFEDYLKSKEPADALLLSELLSWREWTPAYVVVTESRVSLKDFVAWRGEVAAHRICSIALLHGTYFFEDHQDAALFMLTWGYDQQSGG